LTATKTRNLLGVLDCDAAIFPRPAEVQQFFVLTKGWLFVFAPKKGATMVFFGLIHNAP
jgi:hypothetical protein